MSLCAASLYVLLALPASAQEAAPEDLGRWNAVLKVGDGTPDEVTERTDTARDSLVAMARELVVDAQSVSLMQDVREAGLELNLGKLYGMLPEVDEVVRSLRMHGDPEGSVRYLWTLFPRVGASNNGELLALDGLTRMQPVDQDIAKGDGYAVHQEIDVGTGPWRHHDVAALFEGFLVELERAAHRAPTAAEATRVLRHQPRIDGEVDIALVAAFERAAPTLMDTIAKLVIVENVGVLEDDHLELDFLARMDLQGLRELGYPSLARYIDKLDNLLVMDVSIRDGTGLPLVTLGVYTAGPGLRLGMTCDDGALLPRRRGVPDPTGAVRPTDRRVDLKIRTDAEIRAEGYLLRITDYEVPLTYLSGGEGADVAVAIDGEPSLEFTGQGKITSWIASLADSALNLETHGKVIFQAVAEGVDGQGSKAVVRYDNHDTNGIVATQIDMLLVDNALVRMALRIVGRHLVPDDEVISDLMRLVGEMVEDMDRDYLSVRAALAAQESPTGP